MTKLKYHNISGTDVNVLGKVDNSLDKGLSGCRYPELAFMFDKDVNEIRNVCKSRLQDETFDVVIKHEKWILDYLNAPDKFKLNSLLFRSDEFTKNHDGKHIIFSGCSNTYGVSLYNHEIWPWLLYNKIKEKEKVSGYYNLANAGTGVFNIVSDIFKYINNYSKPDVIFINLPFLARFYSLVNDTGSSLEFKEEINLVEKPPIWHHTISSVEVHSLIPSADGSTKGKYSEKYDTIIAEKFIYAYQYLMMLEVFCKINNIQLYVFSHNLSTNWFLSQTDLSSFKNICATKNDIQKNYELMLDYMSSNKNDKFALWARDGIHEGTAYHYAWFELAYSWYSSDNY